MSSKDKTGDKLVASIRKSKTGTVASKTSERPNARETAARSKASASKPVKTKSVTTNSVNKTHKSQGESKLYSHGRRVWPD